MRPARIILLGALGLVAVARADDLQPKYRVVTPRPDGIIATAISNKGDVVGFEWVESPEDPNIVDQVPFHARGEQMTRLPVPEGYTATFPEDVSDDGRVVGRVSKPLDPRRRVMLQNQAFVWDPEGGLHKLGAAEGDWASVAWGISADGRRISGFTVGDGLTRACLWELDGEGWALRVLPHEESLSTTTPVSISDDGRRVVALAGGRTCLWTRDDEGRWAFEWIGEPGSFAPRAVNDRGMVAGVRYTPDGLIHAVVWTREDGVKPIPKPEGFVKSEARALNNRGAVVGMVDGPGGSLIGPAAFVFEDGQLRLLSESNPNFADATAINDRGEVSGVFEQPEVPQPDQTPRGSISVEGRKGPPK